MTAGVGNRLALRLAGLVAVAATIGAAAGAWGAVTLSRPTAVIQPEESERFAAGGLPADDAAGEDLADLPRYPGAVRLEYRVDTQGEWQVTETEYVADAAMDEVRAFYQETLAEDGWSLAEIQYGLGEWVYYVTSDDRVAVIELEPRLELIEIELELRIPLPTDDASPTP